MGKERRLNALAGRRGQTLAQMSLAWMLRHPEVTSTLVGGSKVAQVEDAIGARRALLCHTPFGPGAFDLLAAWM